MNVLNRFRNKGQSVTKYQMITERGNGFYAWNGKLFQGDIIRACIRPMARAVGKTVGKHIRNDGNGIRINPDAYIRFLLEEPNPLMSGQVFQEKMTTQLALNNNAFAVIYRDNLGYPVELYPINAVSVEAVYNKKMELYLKFLLENGKQFTLSYADIIHLRQDVNKNDVFGQSPMYALDGLMEILNVTDQGIVKAIKNSSVIRWLLKINANLKREDITQYVRDFTDSFLNIEKSGGGAAAVDAKTDAQQVEPKDYVPNAVQMEKTIQRIYGFFNTNEKIVQSKFTEDEWISYFESVVEPIVVQLGAEYSRKLFTRRERGFGNKIVFEASNLQYGSMSTKLNLQAMVDRGAMTPNEWREVFNLAPLPGGGEAIRRLDTAVVAENAGKEDRKD